MGIVFSLLAIAIATVIAAVGGLLMGRLSTQWFSGMSAINLLTEIRAALLPVLMVPALGYHLGWPEWLLMGLVVGLWQAGAVARWIARRSGEWSPALVGGIALGRSGAALITRKAAARGAVVATLGSTCLHVAAVEGLFVLMGLLPSGATSSIGAWLIASDGAIWLSAIAMLAVLVLSSEWLASRALQWKKSSKPG